MKKLLIIVGILFVVVVGCSALAVSGGSGSVEVDSGSGDSGSVDSGEPKDGGEVGPFDVLGKVTPKNDFGYFAATLRVENVSDTSQQAWFTVSVLKGNEVLGTLDCLGANDVAAGRVVTVDCTSTDRFRKGWESVEIQHDGW